MKLFICNKTIENDEVNGLINDLLQSSENIIAIQRETEHPANWGISVEQKMQVRYTEKALLNFVIPRPRGLRISNLDTTDLLKGQSLNTKSPSNISACP